MKPVVARIFPLRTRARWHRACRYGVEQRRQAVPARRANWPVSFGHSASAMSDAARRMSEALGSPGGGWKGCPCAWPIWNAKASDIQSLTTRDRRCRQADQPAGPQCMRSRQRGPGEAGRGFAVVADEVRRLADQAQRSRRRKLPTPFRPSALPWLRRPRRMQALQARRWPRRGKRRRTSAASWPIRPRRRIRCVIWWSTIEWRYSIDGVVNAAGRHGAARRAMMPPQPVTARKST